MLLKRIAISPPLVVTPDDKVGHAVDRMIENRIGALLVVEGDDIVGIFTERDVITGVVGLRRDPDVLTVDQVMTREVVTFPVHGDYKEALKLMVSHHFRHLPLLDAMGKPMGMLSVRDIMGAHLDALNMSIASLCSYIGADGPGG